jgi:hypothetical protein
LQLLLLLLLMQLILKRLVLPHGSASVEPRFDIAVVVVVIALSWLRLHAAPVLLLSLLLFLVLTLPAPSLLLLQLFRRPSFAVDVFGASVVVRGAPLMPLHRGWTSVACQSRQIERGGWRKEARTDQTTVANSDAVTAVAAGTSATAAASCCSCRFDSCCRGGLWARWTKGPLLLSL